LQLQESGALRVKLDCRADTSPERLEVGDGVDNAEFAQPLLLAGAGMPGAYSHSVLVSLAATARPPVLLHLASNVLNLLRTLSRRPCRIVLHGDAILALLSYSC
jgi:hypothetical protein